MSREPCKNETAQAGRWLLLLKQVSFPRLLLALAAATSLLALPVRAQAKKPYRVAPEEQKGKERRAARRTKQDWSEAGTRRGVVEFSLGSLTALLAGVLVARGTWELVEAREAKKECETRDCDAVLGPNPLRGYKIAAGLSFGMVIPAALATGFLFARGARVHRDYKKWKQREQNVALRPHIGRRGGGLELQIRF